MITVVAVLIWGGVLLGMERPVQAATYLNSAESMCNGTDATVLNCDDFEDGVWLESNCDFNGGAANAANDGWCGVVTYLNAQSSGTNGKGFNPPNVTGYAVCSGAGAVGTACAATSSVRYNGAPNTAEPTDFSHAMMAEHDFGPSGGALTEVYVREYVKFGSDFSWTYGGGNEKVLSMRDSTGTCCIIFMNFNTWACSYAGLVWNINGSWVCQNQGNDVTIQTNHWYYIEAHYQLNTVGQANGVLEFWMDDCGTDGLGCTGPGTLRASYSNLTYRGSSISIGNFWQENYANDPSEGTSYYDQLVVRTQRISPMGLGGDGTISINESIPQGTRSFAPMINLIR